MIVPDLEPILFETRPDAIRRARDAGLDSFIVDWEWRGKVGRQKMRDTEINQDTPEDLDRLRRMRIPNRYCRVNRFGPWTAGELVEAESHGVTRIFLPMVEKPEEIERVIALIGKRIELGILLETQAGMDALDELARLPIPRVFVGLNDLAISRGASNIFEALLDGTVDRVRKAFPDAHFGVGGMTVLDAGYPIPARLLLAEMARLRANFCFLRRSFRHDTGDRDLRQELGRIREEWRRLHTRSSAEMEHDRALLAAAVVQANGAATPE